MHLRVKKLNLVIFNYASQAELSPWFLASPPRQREITLRDKKVTKTELLRLLVTSVDKSHHLRALYILVYCFAVP